MYACRIEIVPLRDDRRDESLIAILAAIGGLGSTCLGQAQSAGCHTERSEESLPGRDSSLRSV